MTSSDGPRWNVCRMGSTLVVSGSEDIRDEVAEFASWLPGEDGRTLVVLDLPDPSNPWTWTGLCSALRGMGPLRLAAAALGTGPWAPAAWLAQRLDAEVVAADAGLVPLAPRGLYVPDGGTWRAFSPTGLVADVGPRFPAPQWNDCALDRSALPAGVVADNVPSGLWVRRDAVDASCPEPLDFPRPEPHDFPYLDGAPLILLGGDDDGVKPADVVAVMAGLPADNRSAFRIAAWCGRPDLTSFARQVARGIGAPVAAYTGVPTLLADGTVDVVVADAEGGTVSRPLAQVIAYPPDPDAPPVVVECRALRPAPYRIDDVTWRLDDAHVVQVVPCGLWVRPNSVATDGTARSAPLDPLATDVVVEVGSHDADASLLAVEACAILAELDQEHAARARVRYVIPPPPAPRPLPEARSAGSAASAPVAHGGHAAPPDSVQRQKPDDDIADTPATDLDPLHQSTIAEREWLRRTLAGQYDTYAGEVLRLLTRRPGLRAVEDESLEAVVTDLIAVKVYLSAVENTIDSALRQRRLGRLQPYAACVISGLRRLPSYRGVALHAGLDTAEVGDPGSVVTVPVFLNATASGTARLPGCVEFMMWSLTGRRVCDVFGSTAGVDRVLFAPRSAFKVLGLERCPTQTRVYLREILDRPATPELSAQDLNVLARLREVGRQRGEDATVSRGPDLTGTDSAWVAGALGIS